MSYYLLNKYSQAIKYFNKHLTINYRERDIYNYLSRVYAKKKDQLYEKAFREISNLLLKSSDLSDEDLSYKIGLIYLKNEKHKEARTNLLRIYESNSHDYKLNYNIGLCCIFLNDYDLAIQYLEKTVKYYNRRFSIVRMINKLLRTDKKGAKYYLALAMATYLKGGRENQNKAIQIFDKIANYDTSIYREYKNRLTGAKDSKLYQELLAAWEE